MKNICFLNLNMKIGGVERQLYYLINGLDEYKKYNLHLILCKKTGGFLDYISNNITLHDLNCEYSLKNLPLIYFRLLRKIFVIKPDILISFHVSLNIILCLTKLFLSKHIICCFPGYVFNGRVNFIRSIIYKYSDLIIAVSCGVRNSLIQNLNICSKKIMVIENAVDVKTIINDSKQEILPIFNNHYPVIVSLGRLDKGKGFDVFINSFKFLNSVCNYLIIGDGPCYEELQILSSEMEGAERIVFLGAKHNPYPYLKIASIFVLASESEGLPTVVLEAMALNIPVISTEYNGGTKGVVDHNVNGFTVPVKSPMALASTIENLLYSEDKQKLFIENSKTRLWEVFSIKPYVEKYERIISNFIIE